MGKVSCHKCGATMEGAELLSHIKACAGSETDALVESGSRLRSRVSSKRQARVETATREEARSLHGEIHRLKLRIAALEKERSMNALADRPTEATHTHLRACDMCGAVTYTFDSDGVQDCPECAHGLLRTV